MKFSAAMKLIEEGKSVICPAYGEGHIINLKTLDKFMAYKEPFSYWREEWQLYEESVRLLSFAEVVKGLREGKKFKRKGWPDWDEIKLHKSGILHETLAEYIPLIEDFEANDWQEIP
jgi:hypothetical protein